KANARPDRPKHRDESADRHRANFLDRPACKRPLLRCASFSCHPEQSEGPLTGRWNVLSNLRDPNFDGEVLRSAQDDTPGDFENFSIARSNLLSTRSFPITSSM